MNLRVKKYYVPNIIILGTQYFFTLRFMQGTLLFYIFLYLFNIYSISLFITSYNSLQLIQPHTVLISSLLVYLLHLITLLIFLLFLFFFYQICFLLLYLNFFFYFIYQICFLFIFQQHWSKPWLACCFAAAVIEDHANLHEIFYK